MKTDILHKCKKSHKPKLEILREATIRLELMIRELQSHALPLGYVAIVYTMQFISKK